MFKMNKSLNILELMSVIRWHSVVMTSKIPYIVCVALLLLQTLDYFLLTNTSDTQQTLRNKYTYTMFNIETIILFLVMVEKNEFYLSHTKKFLSFYLTGHLVLVKLFLIN